MDRDERPASRSSLARGRPRDPHPRGDDRRSRAELIDPELLDARPARARVVLLPPARAWRRTCPRSSRPSGRAAAPRRSTRTGIPRSCGTEASARPRHTDVFLPNATEATRIAGMASLGCSRSAPSPTTRASWSPKRAPAAPSPRRRPARARPPIGSTPWIRPAPATRSTPDSSRPGSRAIHSSDPSRSRTRAARSRPARSAAWTPSPRCRRGGRAGETASPTDRLTRDGSRARSSRRTAGWHPAEVATRSRDPASGRSSGGRRTIGGPPAMSGVGQQRRLLGRRRVLRRPGFDRPCTSTSSPSGSTTSTATSKPGPAWSAPTGRSPSGRIPTTTSPSGTRRRIEHEVARPRPARSRHGPRSRFIGGDPMNPATNTFAGSSYTSCGGADLLQHAVGQHGDPVAERDRLHLVVRHVDRRDAEPVLQPLQLRSHLDAELRVEVGERFVEQEHLGLAHQRPAHRDALPLPAGQLPRAPPAAGPRARASGSISLDPAPDLLPRRPALPQAEREVLLHRHVRVERVVLEHHRDVAVLRRHVVHHAVADRDRAVADPSRGPRPSAAPSTSRIPTARPGSGTRRRRPRAMSPSTATTAPGYTFVTSLERDAGHPVTPSAPGWRCLARRIAARPGTARASGAST